MSVKKPDPKPVMPLRPGTPEYRDAQRADFDKRVESEKRSRKAGASMPESAPLVTHTS
jgi:hypothetical protein